jgi:spoIIIJ-associated protein
MPNIEISARSIAEATRLALEQLGVDEDDVIIEVLQNGDEDNEALVRVSTTEASTSLPDRPGASTSLPDRPGASTSLPDRPGAAPPPRAVTQRSSTTPTAYDPYVAANEARRVLEGMLERIPVEGFVNVQHSETVGPDGEMQHSIMLYVEGLDEETVGLLIGRRGDTLRSLQFLVNTLVQRSSGRWPQIVIDIGNYRQRRQESLEGLARRVAEQVRTSGRAHQLDPMQPYDRRIIHMALREDTTVRTESTGEGENRRITVYPKK